MSVDLRLNLEQDYNAVFSVNKLSLALRRMAMFLTLTNLGVWDPQVRPLLSLYSLKPAVFSLGIFGCSTSRVSHRWPLSHNPNAALFSLNYAGRGRVQ